MTTMTVTSTALGVDDATLAELNRDKAPTARLERVDRLTLGPAHIDKFRMGNGLTVILWEDHAAPVFSYHTWFRVGSRHEKEGRTGIAHLFEHLMFKATKNMADGEFDQVMEKHGAQTNAATWVDWTYYKEKLPAGNLDLVASLEADRMEHMILNAQQLESEREVVKNERLLRVDNDPDGRMYEELYALAYDVHTYGWPTIGWMKDIEAITLEDCLEFYRLYYAPNNATVVLVGDVDGPEALRTIQKYYGHLQAQPVPAEDVKVEPPQKAEKRKVLELAIAAEKGIYAWHAPAITDPGHAPLVVLNEILVGGESARLHKLLVTDLELASDVGGYAPSWAMPGLYEIGVTMQPGKALADAERAMDEALERVTREPVTARELDKAKNGLEASFLRSLADVGSRARALGDAETTAGDYKRFIAEMEALRKVTADDVLAVARKVLRRENRTVLAARPQPEAAEDGETPDAPDALAD